MFDVGVTNYLARQKPAQYTAEFGKSFEQFILMELMAYQAYKNPELLLHYWQTSSGLEVDFILGDMAVAVEIKSSKRVHEVDCNGLKALAQAHSVKRLILVSFENEPKQIGNIECLPWEMFLKLLWAGQIIE